MSLKKKTAWFTLYLKHDFARKQPHPQKSTTRTFLFYRLWRKKSMTTSGWNCMIDKEQICLHVWNLVWTVKDFMSMDSDYYLLLSYSQRWGNSTALEYFLSLLVFQYGSGRPRYGKTRNVRVMTIIKGRLIWKTYLRPLSKSSQKGWENEPQPGTSSQLVLFNPGWKYAKNERKTRVL